MSGFIGKLKTGGQQAILGDVVGYALNMQENCGRRCMQDLQTRSRDFYYDCYADMKNQTNAEKYPIVELVGQYQGFRNQACSKCS